MFAAAVDEDTYTVASEVHDLLVKTHAADTEKIELIKALVWDFLEIDRFRDAATEATPIARPQTGVRAEPGEVAQVGLDDRVEEAPATSRLDERVGDQGPQRDRVLAADRRLDRQRLVRLDVLDEARASRAPAGRSGRAWRPSGRCAPGTSTTASSGRFGIAPRLRASTTWTAPSPVWSDSMSAAAASL